VGKLSLSFFRGAFQYEPDRHHPRVRDYIIHDTKERAQTRQAIESDGFKPLILCDSAGRYWDGCTVRDSEGKKSGVSSNLQKQLKKMAAWGEFGEEVANAIVEHDRYWHIHDRLLQWPDNEAIQREGFHEFHPPDPPRRSST
jgi:hypothetical protein